ncbi:retrotransposon protein, putative, ty1-copia subclass [Tanacetum coccineum]
MYATKKVTIATVDELNSNGFTTVDKFRCFKWIRRRTGKAIGCLEKEKPTFCLNSKDGLSPMRAGTPDGGVQAQFAERGCCLRAFAYVPFQEERNTCAKACLNSRIFTINSVSLFGLELEMLEGTLKTIEDTMARMDKEVYAIYRHMSNIGSGAAIGKLHSRLQGEEDLQAHPSLSFTVPSYPKLDLDKILVLIKVNVKKAMDSFLKGATRGSTLAMVDAGLVYWEIVKKDESVRVYKRVAELGDPTGQCNLGISYLQNPGEPHWIAVKNILKYLKNTKDMFLVYGGNPEVKLRVDCYCDAGFKTDRDDIKSQTGYVFILNGGAMDWKSSKQSTTAMSATEAEYIFLL